MAFSMATSMYCFKRNFAAAPLQALQRLKLLGPETSSSGVGGFAREVKGQKKHLNFCNINFLLAPTQNAPF